MIEEQKTGLRRGIVLILVALPSLIYLLLTYVLPPPLPIPPTGDFLDPSWQIILTDAFLRGAHFGRDIMYTYGPWGFLASPRGDPRIYPWLIGGRSLIALSFILGTALTAVRRIRLPEGQFFFLAWITLLSDPISVLPIVLLALALPSERGRERTITPIVHLLAIACALTMWIKFTSLLVVGALAVALAAQDLIKRRLPVISLEIVAASLAFWLLASQSLYALPFYLQGAVSLARSYSAEMFASGPYWELIFVAVLMLAIAIPSAILFWYRRAWFLWPSLGWVALVFFQQIKEAFVRHDSFHVWMGIINALLPCTLILLCRAGLFGPEVLLPPNVHVLTRVCAACVVLQSVCLPVIEFVTPGGFQQFQGLAQNADAVSALGAGRSLSADYRQQLEEFRRKAPLDRVAGTADFFPDSQVMLYGNSLQVRLPPVPQAFAAYNSYLSGRNASFFRGTNRPDFVFFDIAPIDNRYPSSSDTLSWLALMDCYEPSRYSGRYLVLRSAGCEDATHELVMETRTSAGKIIATPLGDGYPVWAQIDIRLNRTGSIVAALTRAPLTELAVDTGMGRRRFRISPEAARTGFLLSPLLLDPASFAGLFVEGGIDPQTEIHDMTIIQSDMAQRLYEPEIGVRFYKIHRRRRAQTAGLKALSR